MSLANPAIGRAVTWRYLLALGLIACLSTVSFLTLSVTTSAEDKRAALTREIARQQATSQRIAFFANAYAMASPRTGQIDHRRELTLAVKDMARVHEKMIQQSGGVGLNTANRARIERLFFEGLDPLDTQVTQFLDHAGTIAGLPPQQLGRDHPSLAAINRAALVSIPQAYMLMSDILKNESERAIESLGRIEVGAWIATLTLLVLEGLLIFRPLAHRVRTTIAGLAAAETKAREAAARAEAAMRSRSRFFATMSHEIRTPLNAVIGTTELLLKTRLDDQQEGYVHMARGAGEHLLGLVNDILDLNKLESGKFDLEEGEFCLAREVERVADMIRPQAEGKGLSLRVDCDPRARATFLGDPKRVRQVLVNLIGNAVKFTETGSVSVTVETDDSAARGICAGVTIAFMIRIADTGIGIADADQPTLFADFQQLDSGTSRNYEGSGLGLAISRRIVDLMGGQIGLISTLGQGSTFWFTLPLEMAAPATGEMSVATPVRPAEALSILVAEDNAPNQIIVRHLLESLGHTVVMAANGEEAIERVRQSRFDVVLMDIEMPNLDGVEATRRIRALEGNCASVPIIALTAHSIEDAGEVTLGKGFDGYLAKPISAAELTGTLATIAARTKGADADDIEPEREPRLFNALTFHELAQRTDEASLDDIVDCLTSSLDATLRTMRDAALGGRVGELCRLADALAHSSEAVGGERVATIARRIGTASNPIAEFTRNADFLSCFGRETSREIELARSRQSVVS